MTSVCKKATVYIVDIVDSDIASVDRSKVTIAHNTELI